MRVETQNSCNLKIRLHRSAFGSLSIVGRTPSAQQSSATPTPRAMSPMDVVRIYVPPAPPGETPPPSSTTPNHQRHHRTAAAAVASKRHSDHIGHSVLSASQQSLQRLDALIHSSTAAQYHHHHLNGAGSRETLSGASPPPPPRSASRNAGDRTPTAAPLDHRRPSTTSSASLYGAVPQPTPITSSSRRGSLSRKSPSAQLLLGLAEVDHQRLLSECAHIQPHTGAADDQSHSSSAGGGSAGSRAGAQQRHRASSRPVVGSAENVSLVSCAEPPTSSSSVAVPAMTSFEQLAAARQQQQLRNSQSSLSAAAHQHATASSIEYQPLRRPSLTTTPTNGTGSVSDVVQSAYQQYYGDSRGQRPPTPAASDDDDDDDESSSTSPNSKSMLSTPVNETQPLSLLGSSAAAPPLDREDSLDESPSPSSMRSASRIPRKQQAPAPQTQPVDASVAARPSRIPLKHRHNAATGGGSPTMVSLEHAAEHSSHIVDSLASVEVPATTGQRQQRQRQQIPSEAAGGRALPPPPPPERDTEEVRLQPQHRQQQFEPPAQRQPPKHRRTEADMDSRIAAPLGGVYQFASAASPPPSMQQRPQTSSSSGIRKPTELNKIRIKINQEQRH